MQIITPIEITDDILTSPIAEPDVSAGEVEWVDPNALGSFGDLEREVGSIVEYDGSIFAFPSDSNSTRKINMTTEVVTEFSTSLPIGNYKSANVFDTNKAYLSRVDADSSEIGVFNLVTGAYSFTATVQQECRVGVDGNNGFIYYFGRSDDLADAGIVYSMSKETGAIAALTGTYTKGDSGAYLDGILSNEGFIYAVGSTSKILKIDVKNGSVSEIGSYSGTYYAIADGGDGFMYCVGDTGQVMKIETSGDIVTFFTAKNSTYLDIVKANGYTFILSGFFIDDSGDYKMDLAELNAVDGIVNRIYDGDYIDRHTHLYYNSQNKITYAVGGCIAVDHEVTKIPTYYDSGEQVVILDEHSVYKSAVNTRDNPVVGAELTPPSWVKVSATNKYKMFDYSINTASLSVGDIQLLPAQTATTLSMYGMSNVASVNIIVKENSSSGAEIYNETKDLTLPTPVDDMIANEALYRSKVMFSDLPVFANPWINIVINRADTAENWSIGDIAIGNARTMGVVVYQSSTSRTSYDSVETDDFGNETIISRPSAEYTTFELSLQPIYADYVERILKDSLNKPRVYIGDKGNNEKLFTFGYYERSPITYVSPSLCETTLKVRGLV